MGCKIPVSNREAKKGDLIVLKGSRVAPDGKTRVLVVVPDSIGLKRGDDGRHAVGSVDVWVAASDPGIVEHHSAS